MIFLLDRGVGSLDFDDINILSALENLIAASVEGRHYVIADRDTAAKLLSQDGLSRRAVLGLKRIQNKASENRSLLDSVSRYARVTDTGDITNEGGVWLVPLIEFNKSETTNKATVLAENLLDCDVLEIAAQHTRVKRRLRGIHISVRKHGGGGSTIAMEFDNLCKNSEGPVLCVTDGDRLYPECNASVSSRKCARVAAKHSCVAEHLDMGFRELENIIPLEILQDACECEVTQLRACPDVVGHWDVKKGVRGDWVFRLSNNSSERRFWLAQTECILGTVKGDQSCVESETCEKPDACQCVLLAGLGAEALEKVRTHIESISPHKALERAKTNAEKWFFLGDAVLSWGCAPDPIRV